MLACILLGIAQTGKAETYYGKVDTLYNSTIASAAEVSDWTLNGVTWNSSNKGLLVFSKAGSYAIMPLLPEDAERFCITISAIYGNYIYLHTSPDGNTYTDQGLFTGSSKIETASKYMPKGTRYVKLVAKTGTINDVYLISVTIRKGGLILKPQYNISTDLGLWYHELESETNMQYIYNSSSSNKPSTKNLVLDGALHSYYDFGETDGHSYGVNYIYPWAINNDQAADFYGLRMGSNYIYGYSLFIADESNKNEQITFELPSPIKGEAMPCDYNSDGLTDFLVDKDIYIQSCDNTFTKKSLNVMSQETYENGYAQEYVQVSTFNPGSITSFWKSSSEKYIPLKNDLKLLNRDIDGDGLPDLLNLNTGALWLNKGNDIYVEEQLGGSIQLRDLNGDGMLDLIMYNATTKTVTANIRQQDNSWKSQTLISSLSLDDQIWTYDYDKDGDVDIILPFSYSKNNLHTFLVIMVNDGKGNFTMRENAYSQQLKFLACADIDNDGYYDILAINEWTGYQGNSIVWLKGDAQYKFTLQTEVLYTHQINMINDFTVADINHDGKYELIVNEPYNAGVYPMQNIVPATCQAPGKPGKPEAAYEPVTGYLKVDWPAATDARYSSADLTYELRIGSEPGKGDKLYAYAYADGRRRNLLDGNAGYALNKLIDVSGWETGDYYISVQAINPMRRGSAFSEEMVFTKTQSVPGFILSDERTTSDTLTLSLTSPRDPKLNYIWSLDGGQILNSNADSTVLKLKYTLPGKKRITLQTRTASGDLSPVYERETILFANKFTEAFTFTPSEGGWGIATLADLDNNGQLEALTYNGIYVNDGQGNYTKLGKIFNTNLKFADRYGYHKTSLLDYTGNGMLDIFNTNLEVYDDYNIHLYTNSSTPGDITFPIIPEDLGHFHEVVNVTEVPTWDWNNDGKGDMTPTGYGNDYICINDGDYRSYTQAGMTSTDYRYNPVIPDVNKDGFLDALYVGTNDGTQQVHVVMQLNDGKGYFTEKKVPVSLGPMKFADSPFALYHSIYDTWYLFADINSNGYLDLLVSNGNIFYIYLNNRNESFDYATEIVLPIEGKVNAIIIPYFAYDFDNNGYLDVYLKYDDSAYSEGNNHILYFYENLQTQFYKGVSLPDYNFMLGDMDGDGVQDFGAPNTYYGYGGYKNSTTMTNTPPAPPANIRWSQTDTSLFIEWDPAQDAESPAALLRYNISVKKQGATGDNAYIISPLNGTQNGVPAISLKDCPYNPYYRTATRMEIPLAALTSETNYEIRIQTLDGWNAVSDFSAPVVAQVKDNPQIILPTSICAQTSVSVEYKGTGTPDQLSWNWDGGTVLAAEGNFYEVVWNTPGSKTITVTVGGVTDRASILVSDAIATAFDMATTIPVGITQTFPLSATSAEYSLEWFYNDKDFVYSYPALTFPPGNAFAPLWEVNVPSHTGTLSFPETGYYTLRFTVATPCGSKQSAWYEVRVTDMPTPEIKIVTADAGKSKIYWDLPGDLPAFVNGITVYKEGNKYNDFQLLATLPPSQTSYTDMSSNTQMMTSRYCIAWTTSYGNETERSIPHKGIHLMINKGAGNAWNLYWGQYEGARVESFSILRGTSPDNLQLLAEIAGSHVSYTDLTPPAGDIYYAIEYNKTFPLGRSSITLRSTTEALGQSNIVSTRDAFKATLATNIAINSRDSVTPSQPNMQLSALITPATATYHAANWTIVSGEEWATITADGFLTLTGKGNGSVVVKATTVDGSELSAQKTIEVAEVITSISIRADFAVLTPDRPYTGFYVDIFPSEMASAKIIWSIAKKTSGFEVELFNEYNNTGSFTSISLANITADGSITIRAMVDNGTGMYAEKTLLATTGPYVYVGNVRLDKTAVTLAVNQTEQLMATIYPDNANNKTIRWESNDTKVATVAPTGLITAVGEGVAIVSAITDEGGYKHNCTVTVEGVGIDEVGTSDDRVKIYLSREDGILYIRSSSLIEQVGIYDISGRMLRLLSNPGQEATISDLANGIYIVKVRTPDGELVRKIIKE
ncbi:FG-GAP-like repeat-containing protein [Bacteroidales bacterium OttesenSCG-928-L03]|nr:FG-GAP-like repeat-containing protein [Bacteroidales bacterium OttesenSCG-928-L03]